MAEEKLLLQIESLTQEKLALKRVINSLIKMLDSLDFGWEDIIQKSTQEERKDLAVFSSDQKLPDPELLMKRRALENIFAILTNHMKLYYPYSFDDIEGKLSKQQMNSLKIWQGDTEIQRESEEYNKGLKDLIAVCMKILEDKNYDRDLLRRKFDDEDFDSLLSILSVS